MQGAPAGGQASLVHRSGLSRSKRTYDAAVSISGDLEHARHLALAADEDAARELLIALLPQIEQADRDDLALQVFAQLGEIYLVRGTTEGVRECVRRIRDYLASYSKILDGTLPEAAAQYSCRTPKSGTSSAAIPSAPPCCRLACARPRAITKAPRGNSPRWPTQPARSSPTLPVSTGSCSPTPGFCAQARCATTIYTPTRCRIGNPCSKR